MNPFVLAIAHRARVRTESTVEQQSTTRSTVQASPKTTRSEDALSAERRRRRAVMFTIPCPDCGQRNPTDNSDGTGFLTDPITRICSIDVDCPTCDGTGRVKRTPRKDDSDGRGTE